MSKPIFAVLAATVAMWLGAGQARALTISPLPGTPDASPHTQISFLGVAPDEIHDVTVVGSHSGAHGGRLEPYASEPGASFVLAHELSEGEQVKVIARIGQAHRERRVTSEFTVARLADYPFPAPHQAPATKPGTVQSFASQPSLHPPTIAVTARSPAEAPGDVFIAPVGGYGQWGPMIFERNGALVWFEPAPAGDAAMDLQVEQYLGQPVLVWWQGRIVNSLGIGFGVDEIDNASYQPIATVVAGNGYQADLHDIQLSRHGAAYITAYSLVRADLTSVGGSVYGTLQDAIVQEVDVRTGLVMWEWHADGHIAPTDSYSEKPTSAHTPWDFFHVNSISLDPSGDENMLISARNTWAGYEIDRHTGQIEWRLGGKHTSFHMGPGTGTAWQHDMRWQPDGTITLFDDGSFPKAHSQSRALRERIDWGTHSVALVGRYVRGQPLLAGSQGNDQALAGGASFVGWGEQPYFSEFGPSGTALFEAHMPSPSESYRAYTFSWAAAPASPPSLAVSASNGEAATVYASWNGATDISAWRVLAGPSPAQLSTIATAQRGGFETAIPVQSTAADFAVQALGENGQVLGTSGAAAR